MDNLNIKIYPHKSLRNKNRDLKITEIKSEKIGKLVKQMLVLIRQANGVGLAAPQVGKNLRFSVIDPQDGSHPLVIFNPQIIKKSYRQETNEEGCLSLPGLFAYVKRPRLVTVQYIDRAGKSQIIKARSFLSRILQHEIDHLNATLIFDHTDKFSQGADLLKQWQAGQKPQLALTYPYSY